MPGAFSPGLGRPDVLPGADIQGEAAHQTSNTGCSNDGDGDDNIYSGSSQRCHDDHVKQDDGNRHHGVQQPHDDFINPSAVVAAQQSQRHPDNERNDHAPQGCSSGYPEVFRYRHLHQNHTGTIYHPGPEIPSQLIRAEDMGH